MRRDVFQAIADPTRREIINMLAHKSLNLNAVAENFDVSRPAISKHIKILTECGLIVIQQQGRERYCQAQLQKLGEVSDWVEKYRQFWNSKLDALEVYLNELQSKKNKKSTHRKVNRHGRKNSNSFRQEGNQLIHTRMLNAPRELVWDVWTKPEHIKEWWGPNGFTLTHKSMHVNKGSEWRFTMHGFGKDFENKIEYLEVVKPSLLSYRHGDENDTISFTVYVSFEELGNKTLLTMRSVFQSEEFLAELNRQVNAIEGGTQTLDKLEGYLKTQHQSQN